MLKVNKSKLAGVSIRESLILSLTIIAKNIITAIPIDEARRIDWYLKPNINPNPPTS